MLAAIQSHIYAVGEFLSLELSEGQEYELIDGIVVPIAEPSGKHENLRSELLVSLTIKKQ